MKAVPDGRKMTSKDMHSIHDRAEKDYSADFHGFLSSWKIRL
jgi:hypothetical protein